MRRQRRAIEVPEHGRATVPLTRKEALDIARRARGRLTVSPADAEDLWHIDATQHVGILVSEALEIVVVPKVPVSSILNMMSAGRTPELGDMAGAHHLSRALPAAVASMYARTLLSPLRQGPARSYARRNETTRHVRGRIDLRRTMRAGGLPLPIACAFDELAVDTPLNRTLLAAALRALRIPGVPAGDRAVLGRAAMMLEGASRTTAADTSRTLELNRLQQRFRPAYDLARTLLAGDAPEVGGQGVGAPTFMLDMNRLFQGHITHQIRQVLDGDVDLLTEPTIRFDESGRTLMRPDVLLEEQGARRLVIDLKYKTSEGDAAAADLYQMLAYLTALGLDEGILIHAGSGRTAEVLPLGTGRRITIASVDLTGTEAEQRRQIEALLEGAALGGALSRRGRESGMPEGPHRPGSSPTRAGA